MKILVINAGSSSIKYQLIDMENEHVLAKGMCDRIGIAGGSFKHTAAGKPVHKVDVQMANHGEAIRLVVQTLTDPDLGVIRSMDEISAVGHRVLHGGEKFSASVLIFHQHPLYHTSHNLSSILYYFSFIDRSDGVYCSYK